VVEITDANNCTARDTVQVAIGNAITAAFTAQAVVDKGASVAFTDQSNPTPTLWLWNFADGDTSTAQNPSHTFDTPGQKPVFLVASDGICQDTATLIINVRENCASYPLAADFTATPETLDLAQTGMVSFANESTGAISYDWDFGDSQTSTDVAPSHAYTSAGSYTVTLTAVYYNCSTQTTRTVVVNHTSVGQSETLAAAGLYVYPNPTDGLLHIRAAEGARQPELLRVADLQGRTLEGYSLQRQPDGTLRADLHRLPAGVYMVTVRSGDAIAHLKVILQ
jgi:PKD repeat protein